VKIKDPAVEGVSTHAVKGLKYSRSQCGDTIPALDADTRNAADAVSDLTPTDAHILSVLAEGRNVPANITDRIDRHPNHVSERIATLRDRGLVTSV
jgi:DNA-binding MarR family transcriptional regulator